MTGEECRGFDCTGTLALEVGAALTVAALLLVLIPFFAAHLDRSEKLTPSQIRALRRSLWMVPIGIALAGIDAIVGLLTLWGKIEGEQVTGWLLVGLVAVIVTYAFVAVSIEAGGMGKGFDLC